MDVMAEVGACCVAEVMGTELYTLTPDTVVASARRLAFDNGIDHLLVLENGTLAGIVCKDDLRFAARNSLVSECMSSPVLCIGPDTTLRRGGADHGGARRLVPAGGHRDVPGRHGHARCAGHRRPRRRADRDHAAGLRRLRFEAEGPPRPASRGHPPVRRVPGPHVAQRLPPHGGLAERAHVDVHRARRRATIRIEYRRLIHSRRWSSAARAGSSRRRSSVSASPSSSTGRRRSTSGASTGGFTEALLAHGAAQRRRGRRRARPAAPVAARGRARDVAGGRRLEEAVARRSPRDRSTSSRSTSASSRRATCCAGWRSGCAPGAEGVVLVKPQFELPDRKLKAPGARRGERCGARPSTRSATVARGSASRWSMHFDSPVAGGSGTIEVLGPPALRRAPGEPAPPGRAARPQAARGGRRAGRARHRHAALVRRRRARAGGGRAPRGGGAARHVGRRRRAGRREMDGARRQRLSRQPVAADRDARAGARGRGRGARVRQAAPARRAAAVAPLRPAGRGDRGARQRDPLPPLPHGGAGRGGGAGRRRRGAGRARVRARRGDRTRSRCCVRGVEDRFMFSADASGERLHRRGARVEAGDAPLRETLAAGLLALAGWTPGTPLVRSDVRRGHHRHRGGDAGAGPRAGARARLRDRELAAAGASRRSRAAVADAARRSRRRRAPARRACARSSAPIAIRARIESARRNAERGGVAAQRDVRLPRRRGRAPAGADRPGRSPTRPTATGWATRARRCAAIAIWAACCARTSAAGASRSCAPARLDVDRAMGLRSAKQFPLRNGGLPIVLHVATLT